MGSLYDELGVDSDASADELHRAYRRRARLLHPDRHANRSAAELASAQEAMSRINVAWSVLGDPDARDRYDWERRRSAGDGLAGDPSRVGYESGAEPPAWQFGGDDDTNVRRWRWLTAGPAALLAAIMMLIFVFSAYAGPSSQPSQPTSGRAVPTTNPVGLSLLGRCMDSQPDVDAITDCSQPNGGRVVAVPGSGQGCPSGTSARLLSDRTQVVCVDPRSASGRQRP